MNFVLAHQQEDLMVADCKSSGPSKECAKKRRISDEFSIKADAKTSQSTAAAAVFPVRAKLFENLELDSKEQMSMDEKGYSGYAVVHLKSGAK